MNIAVYCGSGFGNDEKYRLAAEKLGSWIALNGHTLVYGGGDAGLMGVAAKSAFERGGEVIGVIPENIAFISSRPQPYCTQVIKMESMAARKQKMLELADAYVALPGGIGTMDEITEAMTLIRIGVYAAKAVLFNTDGYYEPFRQMLQQMIGTAFLSPDVMREVLFSDDVAEIGKFLTV